MRHQEFMQYASTSHEQKAASQHHGPSPSTRHSSTAWSHYWVKQ